MSDLKLHVVPIALVPDLWLGVEPLLSRALKRHPHLDSEGLQAILLAGRADLIVAIEDSRIVCAIVMEAMEYPKKENEVWVMVKVGNVLALAGQYGVYCKHMSTITDFLEAWSRARGCAKIAMLGRKGWLRFIQRRGWQIQPCIAAFRTL